MPPEDDTAFTAFLAEQETAGHIMQGAPQPYVLPKRLGLLRRPAADERARLRLSRAAQSRPSPDFYIAGDDTGTALHNDIVLARIKEQRGGRRDARLRGEVVKVLQRKRRQIVGTLNRTPLFFYVVPDEARIPYDISVPAPEGTPPLGQKVVVELKEWPDRRKPPEGVITEVLARRTRRASTCSPSSASTTCPRRSPSASSRRPRDIPAQIPPQELARREDFRQLFTLTIDPDDAKDFDDALSYRVLPNGDFEVYVPHRRRVALRLPRHGARRRGALARQQRLPGRPRHPDAAGEIVQRHLLTHAAGRRLVKTAVVTLDPRGETKKFRFAAGVIHSAKRFTYQEAFALLRKPPAAPFGQALHELNAMAQMLRRRRFAKGALDLDFPEVKVRINELGVPTHLEKTENDISHQLIEEFMLLANEVVALELKRRGRPGLYRIPRKSRPGAPAGIPRAGQVDGLFLRRPHAARRKSRSCSTTCAASPARAW
ncbi:MAG: RNB domain-containing ribonuclease [Verrucomicrobiota bacterium]